MRIALNKMFMSSKQVFVGHLSTILLGKCQTKTYFEDIDILSIHFCEMRYNVALLFNYDKC